MPVTDNVLRRQSPVTDENVPEGKALGRQSPVTVKNVRGGKAPSLLSVQGFLHGLWSGQRVEREGT